MVPYTSYLIFLYLLFLVHTSTSVFFFFFNDTATTEIYTLSLHDALPISSGGADQGLPGGRNHPQRRESSVAFRDRKSTRLNSSHSQISYAVFCLKKKKKLTSNRL